MAGVGCIMQVSNTISIESFAVLLRMVDIEILIAMLTTISIAAFTNGISLASQCENRVNFINENVLSALAHPPAFPDVRALLRDLDRAVRHSHHRIPVETVRYAA